MSARDRVATLLLDLQRDFNQRLLKTCTRNRNGSVTIPKLIAETLFVYFDRLSDMEYRRWQNRADAVIMAMVAPELKALEGRHWDPTMVRELRDRLGVTQKELARRLDVSTTTVARWERGESSVPGAVRQIIYMICGTGVDTPVKNR